MSVEINGDNHVMTEETKQATFSGFAVLELMGHRKEMGFVTTEAYGQAVLFRVDTPELPEREFVLTSPEMTRSQTDPNSQAWTPAGAKVKRAAIPPRSCLVAPGSLYAINPCTEEAVRTALEHSVSRPLILIEAPPKRQLPAPAEDLSNSQSADWQSDPKAVEAVDYLLSINFNSEDFAEAGSPWTVPHERA